MTRLRAFWAYLRSGDDAEGVRWVLRNLAAICAFLLAAWLGTLAAFYVLAAALLFVTWRTDAHAEHAEAARDEADRAMALAQSIADHLAGLNHMPGLDPASDLALRLDVVERALLGDDDEQPTGRHAAIKPTPYRREAA